MVEAASVLTLIGVIMIKFAAGILNNWGTISLYVLSYFHYHPSPLHINSRTNSVLMMILLIPTTLFLFLSPKLTAIFGHEKLIRICGLLYLIAPISILIDFNFYTFFIGCLIVPCIAYSASLIPVFHCLYSHYSENKYKATGVAIFSFGLGTIFWNFLSTLCINPNNVTPSVLDPKSNLMLYTPDIADRLASSSKIIMGCVAILYCLGSFLVYVKKNEQDPIQYEENQLYDENQIQVQEPADSYQLISLSNLCQYLKTRVFILLFLISAFGSLFQLYIQFSAKLIYMPLVLDDHLISIGLVLMVASGTLMSIVWGIMGDRLGSGISILIFVIADLAIKIFSCLIHNKPQFIASMTLLGATDKAMLVLFAPTLIDKFGLTIATQLLPFKGVSVLLGIVLPLILKLIFHSMGTRAFLGLLCGFSVVNVILGIILFLDLRHISEDNPEEEEEITDNFENPPL